MASRNDFIAIVVVMANFLLFTYGQDVSCRIPDSLFFNGTCFVLDSTLHTWQDAKTVCSNLEAVLAKIDSRELLNKIQAIRGLNSYDVWIGANDIGQEGTLIWDHDNTSATVDLSLIWSPTASANNDASDCVQIIIDDVVRPYVKTSSCTKLAQPLCMYVTTTTTMEATTTTEGATSTTTQTTTDTTQSSTTTTETTAISTTTALTTRVTTQETTTATETTATPTTTATTQKSTTATETTAPPTTTATTTTLTTQASTTSTEITATPTSTSITTQTGATTTIATTMTTAFTSINTASISTTTSPTAAAKTSGDLATTANGNSTFEAQLNTTTIQTSTTDSFGVKTALLNVKLYILPVLVLLMIFQGL